MKYLLLALLGMLNLLLLGPSSVLATIFVDAWGFEDDVDVVVAPNREFMVVPEEREDGSDPRVRFLDLDPATGQPLGVLFELDEFDGVVGWENGVDPIIIGLEAFGFIILLPCESENGEEAHMVQVLTNVFGAFVDMVDVDLDGLGYREDVDGLWISYTGSIAFFTLEDELRTAQGILAIDVDNIIDGDWGSCLLLSSDGREVCEANMKVNWLPGLADGVDPLAFEMDDRVRLVLPVSYWGGSDLLLVDFDSDQLAGDLPPFFIPPQLSAKDINAAGLRPLSFPGYEWDVDLMLLEPDQCEDGRSIIVPVEGPDDDADLYKLDQFGNALYVFSMDSGDSTAAILGYEKGVDLLLMCGLPVDPTSRLAVPVESQAGTDADLYIVDVADLSLVARAENPALNPGLTIPGYEIGVDLVQWVPGAFAVPVEGADAGIVILQANGLRLDALIDPNFLGYQRSVDPIVAPTSPVPTLILPIGKDDGSDADVLALNAPPFLAGGYSLEMANPGLTLTRFE